jgi:K+-transporting ATPase KdpF subunit
MNTLYLISGLIVLALVVYLLVALLMPEELG